MSVPKIMRSPATTLKTGSPPGGGGGGGGGRAVTVPAALPLCPSLVAVIDAVPTTTPVTSPLPLTVASSGALLDQVTPRPVRLLPLASRMVAVRDCVAPTPRLTLAGLTVTVAAGAVEFAFVPLATFDSAPNTASTFSVPRNATSWNW